MFLPLLLKCQKRKTLYIKSKYVTTHLCVSCISFILCYTCIVSHACCIYFVLTYTIADRSDALCLNVQCISNIVIHSFCLSFSMSTYAVSSRCNMLCVCLSPNSTPCMYARFHLHCLNNWSLHPQNTFL